MMVGSSTLLVRRLILLHNKLFLNQISNYAILFLIPMERRNTMQVENKSSVKYSIKKKAKSCLLKLESHTPLGSG